MNTDSVAEEHRSLTNAPNKLNFDTLVRQLLPVPHSYSDLHTQGVRYSWLAKLCPSPPSQFVASAGGNCGGEDAYLTSNGLAVVVDRT